MSHGVGDEAIRIPTAYLIADIFLGSICVSRSYEHAQEGGQEGLAAATDVVDKLEEPEVEREPFLGDAPMGA
jgi:hypothetical protein